MDKSAGIQNSEELSKNTDSRWLDDVANRAMAHLQSLPVKSLGPAARRLLGITKKPCGACGGTGRVDG